MKKIICLLLSITFIFLASCSSTENNKSESPSSDVSNEESSASSTDTAKFQSINLMQSITPNTVTATDLTKGNKAYVDFVAKLFKESLASDGSNTLISPLSVIYAMGMTANGADGNTKAQLEQVFGISTEDLNQYLYSYAVEKAKKQGAKLSIANSIWYDKNRITVSPDFLQKNADYYGAGAFLSDFNDSQTVNDINGWISENTDKTIEKVIEEIFPDTIMYLINALAFEAEWTNPYTEHSVRKGDFTLESGEKVSADFMYASDGYYIEDENTTGFIKSYKGGYAFVALLPTEGTSVNDYVSNLTGEKIEGLLESRKNYTSYELSTSLPKFETEYSVSLKTAFKNLGATDAFAEADFSKMGTANGNIFISDIIHKTYISVFEKGTKAGAVTVVIMDTESAPTDIKEVYLNRPFVYMLVDTTTYTPFFIGTMMNPA